MSQKIVQEIPLCTSEDVYNADLALSSNLHFSRVEPNHFSNLRAIYSAILGAWLVRVTYVFLSSSQRRCYTVCLGWTIWIFEYNILWQTMVTSMVWTEILEAISRHDCFLSLPCEKMRPSRTIEKRMSKLYSGCCVYSEYFESDCLDISYRYQII